MLIGTEASKHASTIPLYANQRAAFKVRSGSYVTANESVTVMAGRRSQTPNAQCRIEQSHQQ